MRATRPIGQTLSARIREMIVSGEFAAGQHLREVQLAQLFGASRTPVRHALAVNEKDGLLEYHPNRGYVVRAFDPGDIAQAYELRALLEGFAARRAAEEGLRPDLAERAQHAIDAVDGLLDHHRDLDDDARDVWRRHNGEFHQVIIQQSNNRVLGPVLQSVRQIPSVYPPILVRHDRTRLRSYNEEHRRILQCILRREGLRAEFLMREHIYRAREIMSATFRRAMQSPRESGEPDWSSESMP
jgi:GntR family transcriptional regulator, vanillate catabolism transcriptional regulator